MGAWGYGSFDNDTAGDMVAALTKHVTRVADGRKGGDYEMARVAAQFLLLAHGTDILGGPGLVDVIRALARMRSNVQYLISAREPKKLAAELEKELKAVMRRMRACRGCHRAEALDECKPLAKTACAVPVPKAAMSRKPNRNNLGLRPGQNRPKRRRR